MTKTTIYGANMETFLTQISEPFYRKFKKAGNIKYIKCRCVCGKEKEVQYKHFIKKFIRSCGCKSVELRRISTNKGTILKDGQKRCSMCLHIKSEKEFDINNRKIDKLQSHCKNCKRDMVYRRIYGISLEEYNKILERQNYACGCCLSPANLEKKNLFVDHNHQTGEIRGLLCANCNFGIGKLGDNVEGLKLAISYLEKTWT